jgi:D-3-phosphoglycerate dehydrogenase
MPTVALTDYTFPSLAIEEAIFAAAGVTLRAGQWKTTEALVPAIAHVDAILTQFAPINATVIGAMQHAKVIVRYGIGVDNVDLDAAKHRGIPVCNVPDYCIDEVADQTLAFLLALTRQVLPNANHLRNGAWGLATPLEQMTALKYHTIGVVGFGRIGREVVARLRAFKCRVLVHDPVVGTSDVEQAGAHPVPLNELFATADVVTLHCPSTVQTRGLINRQTLQQMKRGTLLINVARGDLVDSTALLEALHTGQLAGAALDVFAPEPIPVEHPIRTLPNVLLASHIASCSAPAVQKLRTTAAQLVVQALRGERLPNVVNGV